VRNAVSLRCGASVGQRCAGGLIMPAKRLAAICRQIARSTC